MKSLFADPAEPALPLYVLAQAELDDWLDTQSVSTKAWVRANAFEGKIGQCLVLPDAAGEPRAALAGYGSPAKRASSVSAPAKCEQ